MLSVIFTCGSNLGEFCDVLDTKCLVVMIGRVNLEAQNMKGRATEGCPSTVAEAVW